MKIPEGWKLADTIDANNTSIGTIYTYEKDGVKVGISENNPKLVEATGKHYQLSLSKDSEPLFQSAAEEVFIEWGIVEFEMLFASIHASHWMGNQR